MDAKTTKGFICWCGREERFPPYVYAHWHEKLEATCPKCNSKVAIWQGEATPWRAPITSSEPTSPPEGEVRERFADTIITAHRGERDDAPVKIKVVKPRGGKPDATLVLPKPKIKRERF